MIENHLQVQYITKWCYQSITAATTITTPTIMLITILIIVFNCEPIMFITKIMFIFTTTFITILVFNAGRPASSHGAPHKTLPLPARPTRTNLNLHHHHHPHPHYQYHHHQRKLSVIQQIQRPSSIDPCPIQSSPSDNILQTQAGDQI